MPGHAHTVASSDPGVGGSYAREWGVGSWYQSNGFYPTTYAGSDNTHDHNLSPAGAGNTGSDGSEITGGVNTPVFTPKYIDIIICVKV